MNSRKLVLIVCIIVLSFAGVGYSAWNEDLYIKSLFATGNLKVVFQDAVVLNSGIYMVNAVADEGVLDIYGEVAPGDTIQVEYDILNDSSLPVKFYPENGDLPEGITLDQFDTVIKPGACLSGNQMIIEPGEYEVILPFVQYNSNNNSGWKDELKICCNLTVVEEPVELEMDTLNEDAMNDAAEIKEDLPIEVSIEESPLAESPIDEIPQAQDTNEDASETAPSASETTSIDDIAEDTGAEDPVINTESDTQVVEAPSDISVPNATNGVNKSEDNAEANEGSGENVQDGEK